MKYSITSTPMTIVLGGKGTDGSYTPTTLKWKTEDGKPHINPELEALLSNGKRYATKLNIYPAHSKDKVYDELIGEEHPLRYEGDEITLDFIKKLIDNSDLSSTEIELEELADDDEQSPLNAFTAKRELSRNRLYDTPLSDEQRKAYQKIVDDYWGRTKDSYWGDENTDASNIAAAITQNDLGRKFD